MKSFLSLLCSFGILLVVAGGCAPHKNAGSDPSGSIDSGNSGGTDSASAALSSGSTAGAVAVDTTAVSDAGGNSTNPAGGTGTTVDQTAGSSQTNNETGTSPSATGTTKGGSGGSADQEFRGVWLTYLELDKMFQGKTEDQAKSAIDTVMDNVKSYGLNTVIFHVRAKSDAYYKSSVFNAAASVKPLIDGDFDPLAYAVDAAHSRGLKLQAWINPYRIGTNTDNAKCGDTFSVSDTYYYNPASQDVQALILRGVAEVVNNYAVDGVQFDDYFYPADTGVIPVSSPALFEKTAYTAYQQQGGSFGIGDWRRAQVDALIASVYRKVHTRDGCVFGVSPRANVDDDYNKLYADVESWMAGAGYLDYICPQIYFGFKNSSSPFDQALAGWAVMKRGPSVKLYIGLGLYKTGLLNDAYAGDGKQEWADSDDIMKRSVLLVRSQKACGGMCFYSYGSFDANSRDSGACSVDVAKREVENLLSAI